MTFLCQLSEIPSPAQMNGNYPKPEQITLEASSKGKVYAVTGGSSGIRRSTALAFAHFGAYVSFCGRDKARIAMVKREITDLSSLGQDGVMYRRFSVEKEDEVEAWIQATIKKFGRLDGAVNVAGLEGPEVVPITE